MLGLGILHSDKWAAGSWSKGRVCAGVAALGMPGGSLAFVEEARIGRSSESYQVGASRRDAGATCSIRDVCWTLMSGGIFLDFIRDVCNPVKFDLEHVGELIVLISSQKVAGCD